VRSFFLQDRQQHRDDDDHNNQQQQQWKAPLTSLSLMPPAAEYCFQATMDASCSCLFGVERPQR
jgi:hypothetical protein